MACTRRIPKQLLEWIVTRGYKRFTVKQLADTTGYIKPSAMCLLLKCYGVKAVTRRQQVTKKLKALSKAGKLVSRNEAAAKLGVSPLLVGQIVNQYGLTVSSERSLKVSANRWGKKMPDKKVVDKKPKQPTFAQKKAQVQLMLSKNRAAW